MGLLKATYGGVEIPVKITRLDRNLSPSIVNCTRSIETVNGSEFLYSNYLQKQIVMEFRIKNSTARELSVFRRKMSKLLRSKEPKKLVFSDEPHLFYNAVLDGEPALEENDMYSTGSITWLIPDGVAYSNTEKEFRGVQAGDHKLITIMNAGTEWVDVDYEITHQHENGFIGLVSQYGVIQLGKVDETDDETFADSETLINDQFSPSTSGWALNQATTVHVVSEHKQTGTMAITNGTGGYALRVTDYGSGEQWHGPSWTKKVPADRNGHYGAKNCTLSWRQYFTTSTFNNRGVVQFLMTDKNKRNVAAMTVFKNELGNNRGYMEFFVNGINKGKIEFDCSWNNPRTGQNAGRSSISKYGSVFTFNANGVTQSFTVPEMENIEVTEISTFIGMWGSGESIGENHVYSMEFISHSVDAQRDLPNRFQRGDVVQIDGESTRTYINGVIASGHEIRGTDYFKVPPGTTEVQFYYSPFSDPPPEIKAKIREEYL